jgi:hypothetical protein
MFAVGRAPHWVCRIDDEVSDGRESTVTADDNLAVGSAVVADS